MLSIRGEGTLETEHSSKIPDVPEIIDIGPCLLKPLEKVPEGLAVASLARDDTSTLPGDDPSPRACKHRDLNAR